MPLGGYAPLPLRLGGTELTGWTAGQFKRTTSDLAACRRTSVSASFTVSKSGATVTITNYYGENGNGSVAAPTATVNGTGDVTLSFDPPIWEDDFKKVHQIIVRGGMASSASVAREATLEVVDGQSVRLRTWGVPGGAPADIDAVVELWFDKGRPQIGDYGGSPDKIDSETEGESPRAWGIYRELQAMRGDAYSKARSGYIHIEHLALARHLAWVWYRLPEEAVNNRTPSRADALLGYWVKVLGVPNYPGDQKWEIRKRCAIKYRRLSGSTRTDIDAAFEEQLGDALVSIERNYGVSLSAPPSPTYWPGGTPGPADLDLGGGTWTSQRSHLFFVLSRSLLADRDNFYRVANSALFSLADNILPAWVTFSWYLDGSGFIINESLLGYDAV